MSDTPPALPPDAEPNLAGLAGVLLNISLTGIMLLRPVYAANGEITDLEWVRLNPAAQRMLRLTERPAESFLTLFPSATQAGVFGFYRDAFLSGQPEYRENLYQHDGLDGYYVLAAQRHASVLVVSFTDSNDQPRTAVENALRESQAREQLVHEQAERPRRELQRVFEQAPIAIAVYRGPNYTIELANPTVCRLWGRTQEQIIGKGLFEALPEVAGMGYEELLDGVMATGVPYVAHAMPAQHEREGRLDTVYWDFVYVPMYNDEGQIDGAMVVANEVTAQVLARQQAEQLNYTLEEQVRARTYELSQQTHRLERLINEAPAAIAVLDGPNLVFELLNDDYQALFPDRQLVGRPALEALPEIAGGPVEAMLRGVYDTGVSFKGDEVPMQFARPGDGRLEERCFNFIYQARYSAAGAVDGLMVFAFEVTEQVQNRRQTDTMQAAMLAAAQRRGQEREDLLSLFEYAPVAVALLREPEHRMEYYNSLFGQLYPGERMRGRTVAEVYPDAITAGVIGRLDHVYQTGETYQSGETPLAGAGSARYVTATYQAYRENDRIAGVALFIHEVTEEVQARQQVEASAHQLQLITNALPVLIGYLDKEERYQFANDAYRVWFNRPPETLLGQSVRDIIGEVAYAGVKQYIDRALAGERLDFESRMPYREDFVKYISTSYIPEEQEGEVQGFYTLVTDITEQVRTRQQLQEQQDELQRVFAQAPVAICVFRGSDYVLELVNPLMGEMLGHAPAWLMGQRFFEALPELVGQGLHALLDGVRQTGTPFEAHSQPIHLARHQTGEVGYFDFVYQPLLGADGASVVCVATEVTTQVLARQQVQTLNEELAAINEEMQATNEELLDSNARLTRTNADLDTFVYSASHDLKSPITNIEGLLLALRQQLPGAAWQTELVPKLLDMMDGAVTRFQQTLGHLTDVSRLQQTLFDQPAEAVDLPALVEAVRLDILPELTAAGATLTLELEDCSTLYFPVKNLRSILYNLLSNAVKYRQPGRPAQVLLRCRRTTPGQVVLEVQDNGLGLTEQQQSELFRLFRRLHTHVSGSGVGLYMVKKMVDNAGGVLTVESQPGVGSTFTVTLLAPTSQFPNL